MTSKTVFITGASSGIGLAGAKELVARGHKVYLHARNQEKLDAALAETGGAGGFTADLSDVGQVVSMVEQVKSELGSIDVLINNAGVLKAVQDRTANGLDVRFAVNTLAPFIIARELLDSVAKDGRIVNLSSAAQAQVYLESLTQPNSEIGWFQAYAQSKMYVNVFTQWMAEQSPGGPAMIALNPGSMIDTPMVQAVGQSARSIDVGRDIIVRSVEDPEFSNFSGGYFDNDSGRFTEKAAGSYSLQECEQLVKELGRYL